MSFLMLYLHTCVLYNFFALDILSYYGYVSFGIERGSIAASATVFSGLFSFRDNAPRPVRVILRILLRAVTCIRYSMKQS